MWNWLRIFICFLGLSQVSKAQDEPGLAEIKTAIIAMDAIGESHLNKCKAKYIEDLKALEIEIAGLGDLDQVLKVKKERESWEKGEVTKPIDPKDNSVALQLRKLRYYFDQENGRLEAIVKKAQLEEYNRIISLFVALEKRLTKAQKLEEAIEVRTARLDLIKSRPAEPVPQLMGSSSVVEKKSPLEESFRDWVETVKFVVRSGHEFRLEDGDVYLKAPGGNEKKIASASINDDLSRIDWVLSRTLDRSIHVAGDRKSAQIHADVIEELSIIPLE